MRYCSDDGKFFDTASECEKYEQMLKEKDKKVDRVVKNIKEELDILNELCGTYNALTDKTAYVYYENGKLVMSESSNPFKHLESLFRI